MGKGRGGQPARSKYDLPHLRGASCPLAARRYCRGKAFHLKVEPHQYFREARLPHLPDVRSMLFWVPAEPASGVNADLSLRTFPVGRFSQYPVDARGVPCGSGSVRHCCGTETRKLDGETKLAVISSGCRHRSTCIFSAA
ncbi:hypothetical protein TcG_10854 [Trypanosoma cruzi]|nr:hypothetical protein TcG_10854 [Trypanosoma cruzi]